MVIEIHKLVNVGVPLEENTFWKTTKTRTTFILDKFTPMRKMLDYFGVDKDSKISLFISTPNKNVIFSRDPDITSMKVEEIDGDVYITNPMNKEEFEREKHKKIFFMPKETLCCINYIFEGDCENELAKLNVNSIVGAVARHLSPEKKVYRANIDDVPADGGKWRGNDILIDGKKICGIECTKNDTGSWDAELITVFFDRDLAQKYLKEEDFSRKSGLGITGIENEIPGYNVDLFIEDYVDEFQKRLSKLLPNEPITIKRF